VRAERTSSVTSMVDGSRESPSPCSLSSASLRTHAVVRAPFRSASGSSAIAVFSCGVRATSSKPSNSMAEQGSTSTPTGPSWPAATTTRSPARETLTCRSSKPAGVIGRGLPCGSSHTAHWRANPTSCGAVTNAVPHMRRSSARAVVALALSASSRSSATRVRSLTSNSLASPAIGAVQDRSTRKGAECPDTLTSRSLTPMACRL
jgi:hypothetical protein